MSTTGREERGSTAHGTKSVRIVVSKIHTKKDANQQQTKGMEYV